MATSSTSVRNLHNSECLQLWTVWHLRSTLAHSRGSPSPSPHQGHTSNTTFRWQKLEHLHKDLCWHFADQHLKLCFICLYFPTSFQLSGKLHFLLFLSTSSSNEVPFDDATMMMFSMSVCMKSTAPVGELFRHCFGDIGAAVEEKNQRRHLFKLCICKYIQTLFMYIENIAYIHSLVGISLSLYGCPRSQITLL